MVDSQKLREHRGGIPRGAQRFCERCGKTLMKVAEEPGSLSECHSVPEAAPQRGGSAFNESENSMASFTSAHPDAIWQLPQPVSAKKH